MIHEHTWVDDPQVDIKIPCPLCTKPMDALIVEPKRSDTYLNAIWLCQGAGKHVLPRYDARRGSV